MEAELFLADRYYETNSRFWQFRKRSYNNR